MNELIRFFISVALLLFLAALMTLPTMWLWNWLIPTIFGLIEITFWQALGLNLLTGILFRTSHANVK